MSPLFLTGTGETPGVTLDKDSEIFEFTGKSLPEDAKEFYGPILSWFDAYLEDPRAQTTLKMKMDYFNTASSKMLLEVFERVKTLQDDNLKVVIEWHYHEDDEDMYDAGQDYSDMVGVPFEFISHQQIIA
jgi:Domain of unknown function (DUF1987).